MVDWEFITELVQTIAEIGKGNREIPPIHDVTPFKDFFNEKNEIKYNELDELDGKFTRREVLARYLLLSVVLDQGPDIKGVRQFLKNVTNGLYRKGIRIFHSPTDFFNELGISINEILEQHETIKNLRSEDWAEENNANASRYSLFFAQSMRGIISTRQVTDYAIHRWGVPLCVPILLEHENKTSPQPLIDYIESYDSAEIMAQFLKDHEKFGLGSAIGDKACHLFTKMYVNVFKLI
ncbi:MAG: hypothetical protein ACTSQQ_08310, partial [Candidatus Helarchaeota archaeon]